MKQRCYYVGHIEFQRYGGRGITVCDEWLTSFETFLRDMGDCPTGSTLDRIDINGPYSPTNCRWATRREQMNNTSRNVRVEYEGRTFTLKELAFHLGVNYFSLHAYVQRRGLSLTEAIARAQAQHIKRHLTDPVQSRLA